MQTEVNYLEVLRSEAGKSLQGTPLTWESENGFAFACDPHGVTLFVMPMETIEAGYGFALQEESTLSVAELTAELLKDIDKGEQVFASWSTLAPMVMPTTRSAESLLEMDEATAIRRHICGNVFVVLSANMPMQITVLPEATLSKMKVSHSQAWKAARENVRNWFARRLFTVDEHTKQVSPSRIVRTLLVTDEDLVSTALVDQPMLIAKIAQENGLTKGTAFSAPIEGVIIIGEADTPAISAIRYEASRIRKATLQQEEMNGMPELTRDVFIINPDGSLKLEGILQ